MWYAMAHCNDGTEVFLLDVLRYTLWSTIRMAVFVWLFFLVTGEKNPLIKKSQTESRNLVHGLVHYHKVTTTIDTRCTNLVQVSSR